MMSFQAATERTAMEKFAIVGTGDLAKECLAMLRQCPWWLANYRFLGFICEREDEVGKELSGFTAFATDGAVLKNKEIPVTVVFPLGDPQILGLLSKKYSGAGHIKYINAVHPSVTADWSTLEMGHGNILCAGNIFTNDIVIGNFNYLNLSCTFGHNVRIGNACVVNPGANVSGCVSLGDAVLVGTGATILQGIKVGSRSIIGAGAVVTKDVAEGETVAGVPAKVVNR